MSRLKDLFKKSANVQAEEIQEEENRNEQETVPVVPEGLWVKCPKCGELLYKEDVVNHSIDTAQMGKLNTVSIIHGKGTGALRQAVHQTLRRHSAVKSFRLGRYGEGEDGVTVVELK